MDRRSFIQAMLIAPVVYYIPLSISKAEGAVDYYPTTVRELEQSLNNICDLNPKVSIKAYELMDFGNLKFTHATYGFTTRHATSLSEEWLVRALWRSLQAVVKHTGVDRPTLIWRRLPEYNKNTRTVSMRCSIGTDEQRRLFRPFSLKVEGNRYTTHSY